MRRSSLNFTSLSHDNLEFAEIRVAYYLNSFLVVFTSFVSFEEYLINESV